MTNTISFDLKEWQEIKDDFVNSTLVIGNGTSIAIDEAFKLFSLKQIAEEKNWLNDDLTKIFTEFDKRNEGNFELILQFVWHAKLVNDFLGVDNKAITDAYEAIKKALIKSVREGHCDYLVASSHFSNIYQFIASFSNIVSLNYDLLLYWVIMYGNEQDDGHEFADCFLKYKGEHELKLEKDLKFLRRPYTPYARSGKNNYIKHKTLVFYPHGNLILLKNIFHQEIKLEAGRNSIQRIETQWQTNQFIPLFVSEGTAKQKKYAISQSRYLSFIYDDVLPNLNEKEIRVVIVGWSLGDQDEHILEQIISSKNKELKGKIAIGVREGSKETNCPKFFKKIKKYNSEVDIIFFDSQSSGCWNNS